MTGYIILSVIVVAFLWALAAPTLWKDYKERKAREER